ncbi:hypothetical protein Back2_07530 [Nocardioides baekrokdamisoli]|uniref:Uracil-DNA glycosylase-like domain-containing protein n=1 Tax=Nocardioides baekrokdamisoli TaxID=1804624 RepID=A0A3G9IDN4_9ACTN|nr:uracil-DNA glycosylase family protein [Nocardioides baekrokdamisoli]BBH16466.1 hypothetical protein Back2_07530 [Nocardioides baekrokdamisoli]
MDGLITELLDSIPESLREESGTAFESGLRSWTGSRPLYLLGYNPGGAPGDDTVHANAIALLRDRSPDFSNYVDGQWPRSTKGTLYPVGEDPMQRRVRYLLDRVNLAPGEVPTSNIIYARSAQAAHLEDEKARNWAEECWPFHARMIERLGVRVVVCFGNQAGDFVARKLGATPTDNPDDTFRETYENRSWRSRIHTGPGPTVVQLSHPSRADWTAPEADPTGLVLRALEASE